MKLNFEPTKTIFYVFPYSNINRIHIFNIDYIAPEYLNQIPKFDNMNSSHSFHGIGTTNDCQSEKYSLSTLEGSNTKDQRLLARAPSLRDK